MTFSYCSFGDCEIERWLTDLPIDLAIRKFRLTISQAELDGKLPN